MSSQWTTRYVEDISSSHARAIAIGPFGSALKATDYCASGVPVVRGQDIREGRSLASESRAHVPEEFAAKFPACLVSDGDLVFPHRGAIGRVGIVEDETCLLSSSMMKLSVDKRKMSPLFVFYYFRGPGREELLARASTVGTPGIGQPLASLRRIPISFPNLDKQRAIAEVLGALDDKIAANDRVLGLLAELVRARFDSLTGEPIVLSALATGVREQADPQEVDQMTPYVGLEHMPRRRIWLSDAGRAADVTSAKSTFRQGDVLFGKLRPYFHKVVSAPFDGIASTDILIVRAIDPDLAGFVLAAASSDIAVAATVAASEGTRMPRTKWSDLAAVELPWPGEVLARGFSADVSAAAAWAAAVGRESRALARTRDELLPLLMSGRLRVRDAEAIAGEVL
jgi:type I restriction enzyme, S subunit